MKFYLIWDRKLLAGKCRVKGDRFFANVCFNIVKFFRR